MTTAVDLFTGLGGFTEGAAQAGVDVVWAANHWESAVKIHELNHQRVAHACQDLRQADFTQLPEHDILLASPSCQGHSKARGKDRPHHDAARSTAWAVVDCMEANREQVGVIENVKEFADWELYPSWCGALRRLGYSLAEYTLDAADFGVPQHRTRLIIVATRSESPIKLNLPSRNDFELTPVSGFIEWDNHKWSKVDKPGRAKATLERVRSGRKVFGDRFVMPYYSNGSGKTGRSIHRPLGTLTTRSRWAVVDGDRMRMLQPGEAKRIMGFRDDYIIPTTGKEAHHMIGNAVAPPKITRLLNEIMAQA